MRHIEFFEYRFGLFADTFIPFAAGVAASTVSPHNTQTMNQNASFLPSPALRALALCCPLAVMLTGCVSSRFQKADEETPPPVMLNVRFPAAPLQGKLETLITYNGPGSWK